MLLPLAITAALASNLVRVDVPNHPEAIASSAEGSTLLGPPSDNTAWREEPVPEPTGVITDGWTATEAIRALAAQPWHEAGLDGSGVRLAIFDIQWFGLEQHPTLSELTSHDCFGHRSCALPIDTVRPQFAFETGSHGIACAEVVQAIAPGAELHLVRVNGLTALENAVDWAIREDIDLISMSMSFFSESFYDGTGAINAAVDDLVDAGILLVSSAGNYAKQHRVEQFRDQDLDGRHDFESDSEYLPIYLPKGTTRVSLTWDDYRRCGSTDFDAYIYDADGLLVGRSTRSQSPDSDNCFPLENISAVATEEAWHYLMVHRAAGNSDVRFKVMTRSGQIFEPTKAGSITDPGSHPHVFTVGAVNASDYRFNPVESFSSQGPTEAGIDKPDIAGPDGLTTSPYGPTGFYGTSASTPSVAAALALLMDHDPSLSARDAAIKLTSTAISVEPVWTPPDPALGAGKARLPSLQETHSGCGQGTPLLMVLCWIPLTAIRRRK